MMYKPMVLHNIPADCIQHKLFIYFFLQTVVEPPEVLVFFYIPKMSFRLD